jgi:peptidyl-prolyl cis-trans isomerase C
MKRLRVLLVAALCAAGVAACDGLKEAFTAHVDLVARAGGQELSTERLAGLMANSQIPVQHDVAQVVADFWVSYQLLGLAGAHGDSLNDPKLVDQVMWAPLAQARARKFFSEVIKKKYANTDTSNLEQRYAQGEVLSAQHILIMMPQGGAGMSEKKQDSLRQVAEGIRKRVTSENFSQLAKQYSEDPGSKDRGGSYPAFLPGAMVPEFENGVRALKPGEISSSLVHTSYGFHIIRRHLLSEVHPEFVEALLQHSDQAAESTYFAQADSVAKIDFKPNHVAKAREVAANYNNHIDDRTVLASSRRGDFTAGKLAKWLQEFGPSSNYRQYIMNGPDSAATQIIRIFARNEILIADAQKAGIQPDTEDVNGVRRSFDHMLQTAWYGLGVDPGSLGDSAKTKPERERLAASRVEDALDRLFQTNGQAFVDITPQLANALRMKYSYRVNPAGVERALERAQVVRAALDSTRARQSGGVMPGGAPPMPVSPPPGANPTMPPVVPPGGRGGRQ